MGYTLRATLDAVGQGAQITVCELFEEIVVWNQGFLDCIRNLTAALIVSLSEGIFERVLL